MVTSPKAPMERLKRVLTDPIGVIRRKSEALHRRLDPARREEDRLSLFTGPSGYWNELREYQLSFLKSNGLRSEHSLLDIACGPLQGGIAFITYLDAGKYVGVDISDTAIAEAYMQIVKFGLGGKNPRLIRSDNFGDEELHDRRFDFAWCCQTMYIFPPAMLDRFFAVISVRLKVGGTLFGDILTQKPTPMAGDCWKGYTQIQHSLQSVEALASKNGLSMTPVGQIDQFGYPVPCALRENEMLRFDKQ